MPGLSVCNAAPVLASQSLIVSSHEPDTTSLPSGEKTIELTELKEPNVCSVCSVCSVWSVCSGTPVLASQSLTDSSFEPDTTSLPSGEKASDVTTELTKSEWPSGVCNTAFVPASQSLTVLSLEPDTTSFPSGENATELTWSEWPLNFCSAAPVPASQSL